MTNSRLYSNIAVYRPNPFRPYHNVVFNYTFPSGDELRLYEQFRSKEEADFWAQALKAGKWAPLDQKPTAELRKRIENG